MERIRGAVAMHMRVQAGEQRGHGRRVQIAEQSCAELPTCARAPASSPAVVCRSAVSGLWVLAQTTSTVTCNKPGLGTDLGCYHPVNLASRPTTCGGAPPGPSIDGTYLAIGTSVCCGSTGPQNRHMRKGVPTGSRVPK
jgi:hypothetical protein